MLNDCLKIRLCCCRDVKQSAARYDLDSEDDWSEKLRVNAAYDDPFQSAPMDMEASAWER